MTKILVLGGAASGKSAYAEKLIFDSGLDRTYIATAQAFDDEMRAKIFAHQAQRGPDWRTLEAPNNLPETLASCPDDQAILVDCATLWLSNRLLAEADLEADCTALVDAFKAHTGFLVIVSNEVGQGVVPENALARRFRNAQGRLNQALAAEADHVFAVMAGLPLTLKGGDL